MKYEFYELIKILNNDLVVYMYRKTLTELLEYDISLEKKELKKYVYCKSY